MDSKRSNTIKEKGAAMRLRLSNKWQDFSERMHHKRRLVLMDTDTFKENFSMELTGVNIFTYVGISVIVLLLLSMLLIAFTPLHNLIPGYVKPEQREEIVRSAQTIDSLELIIEGHEQMIATIQDVISGKSLTEEQKQQAEEVSKEAVVYRHSKSDSLLRLEIEAKQKQYKDAKKKKK
jgi:sensor histidine kinase YesM